ncbi:hypothetical protein HDV00_008651 [Rhizophlyctis rosea]|nr:hypothetical protein HDV00_008651 [Rhizophlyctis rosea]
MADTNHVCLVEDEPPTAEEVARIAYLEEQIHLAREQAAALKEESRIRTASRQKEVASFLAIKGSMMALNEKLNALLKRAQAAEDKVNAECQTGLPSKASMEELVQVSQELKELRAEDKRLTAEHQRVTARLEAE